MSYPPPPAAHRSRLLQFDWTAGLLCLMLAVWFVAAVSWVGLAALVLEGLFVAGLGVAEWRQRHAIAGGL